MQLVDFFPFGLRVFSKWVTVKIKENKRKQAKITEKRREKFDKAYFAII